MPPRPRPYNSRNFARLEFLKALKGIDNKNRPIILKHLNDAGIDLICECISNILFRNHGFNKHQKLKLIKTLKGREKKMATLARRANSHNKRRNLLIQHGGNPIAAILSVALPFLTNLLFRPKSK